MNRTCYVAVGDKRSLLPIQIIVFSICAMLFFVGCDSESWDVLTLATVVAVGLVANQLNLRCMRLTLKNGTLEYRDMFRRFSGELVHLRSIEEEFFRSPPMIRLVFSSDSGVCELRLRPKFFEKTSFFELIDVLKMYLPTR